ncbi:ATPase [Cryptococcus neoformans Tu401-1]|nr:ATPase [Cryptococcus neoformans var. grubii Tu401-1]
MSPSASNSGYPFFSSSPADSHPSHPSQYQPQPQYHQRYFEHNPQHPRHSPATYEYSSVPIKNAPEHIPSATFTGRGQQFVANQHYSLHQQVPQQLPQLGTPEQLSIPSQYPYQSTHDQFPRLAASSHLPYGSPISTPHYQQVSQASVLESPSLRPQSQGQSLAPGYQQNTQAETSTSWPLPPLHTLPFSETPLGASLPTTTIVPSQNGIDSPNTSIKIRFRPPLSPVTVTEMVSSRSTRRSSQVHQEEQTVGVSGRPQRGTTRLAATKAIYKEDDDEEIDDAYNSVVDDDVDEGANGDIKVVPAVTTRSGRTQKAPQRYEDDFEHTTMSASPEMQSGRRISRGKAKRRLIVDPDEDEEENAAPPPRNAFPPKSARNSLASANADSTPQQPDVGTSYPNGKRSLRSTARSTTRTRHSSADADEFEPTEGESTEEHASSDPLGNYDEEPGEEDFVVSDDDDSGYGKRRSSRRRTTRATARNPRSTALPTRRSTRTSAKVRTLDSDEDSSPHKRPNLRERTSRPNYHIPTLEELSKEISTQEALAAVAGGSGRSVGGFRGAGGVRYGGVGLPFAMRAKDLTQAMGDPDTSDSDDMDFTSPFKSGAAGPSMSGGTAVAARGAAGPSDVPNFGRINPKSTTADADPLGVDMNVTFDNVGGLDNHINQLKEMVALPLLYPEVFQQFGITPPRGVLFHGPPGTGKTLLARALAASCSSGNTKISFFMRKGADVLSKWVGEAERQLRMLFEEARASQPSIIFFDEIDGLAPVRSSKQDQIHASLVSTLLALMDGMDGRGQVIVIGATNRPDAVDPALRRPGRFDREFYFALPNREARKKIISINTRSWEPRLSDEMLDKLASLTKGYGGADLRALCTEAALNAIQRRYPQIYKTVDRLQLETKSIHVKAKDFMLSIKKIVPSSARSTSSPAIQLPSHLLPLLSVPLKRINSAVDHVLPPKTQSTALEEAEYEDEAYESFEKHIVLQSLDKLRTFRPRILVHGQPGMGQIFLGPAVLHHLEGFHIQSLDLGTLLGDSTRSVEATIVQLFVEAKRHQPSVIFIPSLSQWASAVPELARSTFGALLDGIPPSDPILLLAMADSPWTDLPADVKAWFGFARENKIALDFPNASERSAYFTDLLTTVRKPPTDFPDGVPRRKRVLEDLPLAAPLPPRQPTEAERARDEEKDQAARNMMVVSFTNLVKEFMKRYRKVVASVKDDAMELSRCLVEQAAASAALSQSAAALKGAKVVSNIIEDANNSARSQVNEVDGGMNMLPTTENLSESSTGNIANISAAPVTAINDLGSGSASTSTSAALVPTSTWQAHNVDIDIIQRRLIRHKYYSPEDFLADIRKIEENAIKVGDPERQAKVVEMGANARLHISGFDPKWTPEFERYAERMRAKKAARQKKKEQAKETGEENGPNLAASESTHHPNPAAETSGVPDAADTTSKRPREEDDGAEIEFQGREKRLRDDQPDTAEEASVDAPGSLTSQSFPPNSACDSPHPDYPPFVLPEQDLQNLQAELETATADLTVDQLEQLRATLFDKLWDDRKEWNRTMTVIKMRQRLQEYIKEVNSWKND